MPLSEICQVCAPSEDGILGHVTEGLTSPHNTYQAREKVKRIKSHIGHSIEAGSQFKYFGGGVHLCVLKTSYKSVNLPIAKVTSHSDISTLTQLIC